ncbi:MAG: dicarboxylate/amino acid:cation symporter [Akkermansiaceae bacterium]|nr:dicarboxylate/amino acid:cation symporter [Akkermansiaceae bacterium]
MKNKPHWQILLSLVLATATAIVFRQLAATEEVAAGFIGNVMLTCEFVGKLFMNLLKMIIVPLVVSSVVAGIASLHGMKGFGRLLGKTAGFYAMTSLMAITLGLVLVNTIQPGLSNGEPSAVVKEAFDNHEASESAKSKVESAKAESGEQEGFFAQLTGFFLRMVPVNIFGAASENGQMLGLIFFSICFAVAMTRLPKENVSTLKDAFVGLNDVMIVMTRGIMALAPIGVYALIVPVVYQTGGELYGALGKYFITVLLALGIHLFVIMPLVISIFAKVSPGAHFKAMRTALLTAFSTASSSSTLPVTMRCIQENAGVSKKTASFTLPLGATVNMDGTALYECVAVMFVAQVMGIEMTFAAQFMVVLAALLTSVGVAGIPSASLVAIFIILTNSGIPGPEKAVVVLLAVDRLLDMTRTAVNVFGDSCCALVIAKSEGENVLADVPRKA